MLNMYHRHDLLLFLLILVLTHNSKSATLAPCGATDIRHAHLVVIVLRAAHVEQQGAERRRRHSLLATPSQSHSRCRFFMLSIPMSGCGDGDTVCPGLRRRVCHVLSEYSVVVR